MQQLFTNDQLSKDCARALSLQLGSCDATDMQQIQGVFLHTLLDGVTVLADLQTVRPDIDVTHCGSALPCRSDLVLLFIYSRKVPTLATCLDQFELQSQHRQCIAVHC